MGLWHIRADSSQAWPWWKIDKIWHLIPAAAKLMLKMLIWPHQCMDKPQGMLLIELTCGELLHHLRVTDTCAHWMQLRTDAKSPKMNWITVSKEISLKDIPAISTLNPQLEEKGSVRITTLAMAAITCFSDAFPPDASAWSRSGRKFPSNSPGPCVLTLHRRPFRSE